MSSKRKIIIKYASPDSLYELINVASQPKSNRWVFTQLRSTSLRDGLLQWQIGFDPSCSSLIVWHGQVGMKIQVKKRTITTNNSGRSMRDQALLEGRQKYLLKIRKGYLPVGSSDVPMIKIMRAEKYTNQILKFPLSCETKFNGIRMWARKNHMKVEGFSRGNKEFPHIYHILNECDKLLDYLPYNSAIDGEMFHHDIDFETITSIARTVKEKHPLMYMLEYYIFDIWWPENPPYEIRRQVLEDAISAYREDTKETKLFLTERRIVNSVDEIYEAHDDFVSRGYEGTMIKKHSNGAQKGTRDYKASTYLFGKGTRILKLKNIIDEEGTCVSVSEASGTEKGCAMLEIEDIRGNRFFVRMGGSLERRRRWFQNPEEVLGKKITFEYQTLSKYGVPIFPVGVEVRDYE